MDDGRSGPEAKLSTLAPDEKEIVHKRLQEEAETWAKRQEEWPIVREAWIVVTASLRGP